MARRGLSISGLSLESKYEAIMRFLRRGYRYFALHDTIVGIRPKRVRRFRMATNSIGTTVILIRHADRTSSETDQDPPLNDKGKARAQTLVHVLGTAGVE